MKTLYEEVVNNRDLYARSGCALAFGAVYDRVGGLAAADARSGCPLAFGAVYDHVGGVAAGAVLKTTVGVLMFLSNDPHPVVHFLLSMH